MGRNCPCCCEGPPALYRACSNCSGAAPQRWQTSIAGVAAGTCSSAFCGTVNRTWNPSYYSVCFYQEQVAAPSACGSYLGWRGQITVGLVAGTYSITATFRIYQASDPPTGGGIIREYKKTSLGPFNCLTSHTLTDTGIATPVECDVGTWPSTIVVEPSASLL